MLLCDNGGDSADTVNDQSCNSHTQEVFRAMDRDGNGRLEPAELREALTRLRLLEDTRPTSASVSGPKSKADNFLILWRFLDPENVGYIYYKDFEAGLKQVRKFVQSMDNKKEVMQRVAAAEEAIAARAREQEREKSRRKEKVKRGHVELTIMGKYGLAAIHYLRHIVPSGDSASGNKTRTLFGVSIKDAETLFVALAKSQGPGASGDSKVISNESCEEMSAHTRAFSAGGYIGFLMSL